MKEIIRLIAIILLAILLITACQLGGDRGTGGEARTYFESLNLDSPEEAVQTFTEAFQGEDFMTVYLVLDAEAQKFQRAEFAQTFSWVHLIGESAAEDVLEGRDLVGLTETHIDSWYIFDQVMLYAAEEDDLLIDLRGDIKILSSEEFRTSDGARAAEVIAEVDGVRGEVEFRLLQDPDRRWRVYMVAAPDEDVEAWPSTALNQNP